MSLPSYYFGLGMELPSVLSLPWSNSTVTKGLKVQKPIQVDDYKYLNDEYTLSFEVSGIYDGDIVISPRNGVLAVEIEKDFQPNKVAHTNWEKSYGIFTRYFSFPEDADLENVQWQVAQGVLTVKVGKTSQVTTKKTPQKTATKAPQPNQLNL